MSTYILQESRPWGPDVAGGWLIFRHCSSVKFCKVAGFLHHDSTGGAKNTIPSACHATGNLRMNSQKHTHICHRPKLPMVDCTSSELSSVRFSALPTGEKNDTHVINLRKTALQLTGRLKNSKLPLDCHHVFSNCAGRLARE